MLALLKVEQRCMIKNIHPTLLKKIIVLALPVMLSNLLQGAITVIDTIMIGRLGPIPIAAVGMGNTLRLFLLILVLSVAGGAISLIAQAKGSRDPQRMSVVTRQALLSGFLLSILLGIIGYLIAAPALNILNQGAELSAVELGVAYLHILFLGTPFLILNVISNKLMQGAGDTVTPLLITIAVLVLNIFFNYVFIFGWAFVPAFGVVGAALGTILARAIMLGFTFWLFYSGKNVVQILEGTWRPNWLFIKDILAIGVPSGIQGIFRHGSNLLMIGLVTATSLGTYGAAVLTIGLQVEQIIYQPIVGMNVAATTIIGQDMGKWQPRIAYQKGYLLMTLGILATLLLVIPFYFFIPEVVHLFDPSAHPAILEGSISYFKITLLASVFAAAGIIFTGTLRGAGDTQPAMYSAIINRSLFQIGIGWYLAFPMAMGYIGIWISIVIGRFLNGLMLLYFWWRQRWVQTALEKTTIYRTHLKHLSEKKLQEYLSEIRSPLMAEKGMMEQVEAKKVRYLSPTIDKTIYFSEGQFNIPPSTFNI